MHVDYCTVPVHKYCIAPHFLAKFRGRKQYDRTVHPYFRILVFRRSFGVENFRVVQF
jgi:hypothetical protein